ncbi:putative late blight resistance protein homolog R1C-3 [Primulina eburnea]|uniref:putative late blight resistance protein homolog R1C-3 n=1 Tax=Primulina eburnea TaxID=1245227 RepID=UPI003C6C7974
MAHAALSSLMQTLEEIHHPHPSVTSLKERVGQLLDFLENSSEKRSSTITDLGRQITDAAYGAEDVIESFFSKQILPKSSTFSWRKKLCAEFQNVIHHISEMKLIHKTIHEFEFILESVSKIKDGKVVEDLEPTKNFFAAASSKFSSRKKTSIVGSNEDFIQIKDRLTGSSSKLETISIVGMGGIGKTTLARNLYDDSLIEYHFDTRAWVTVSQDYSVQEIFRDLLKSSGSVKDEFRNESIGKLGENLYKSLKGRRYLIVMDDVWDTKVWDDVKRFFPDEYNGSRIVLTSRLSEVALYENSISYVHHMNLLGLEESWNLLCIKVFGEESPPYELEGIGKKIAWNCKGLPLAIVVIGGLLSKGSSKTREYWEIIAENVTSTTSGTDYKIMEILSSSYDHLPHHLKSCFLYMGAFPEDQEIFLSQLIMLWVAEGFLKPLSPKSSEEVAEEYLNDLIDRSLVMVGRRNHLGKIKTCRIHDLLRDLCVKKAMEEKFLQVRASSDGRNSNRRVSVQRTHICSCPSIHELTIRSLLYFTSNFSSGCLVSSFIASFRLLKVLDALPVLFYEFPFEIFKLVNLRYLAFAYMGKGKLPSSISNLQNLQTLIFRSKRYFYLPSDILKMPRLRHLILFSGGSLLCWPSGLQHNRIDSFSLQDLITLSRVENFKCTKEVIQIMPNLKRLGVHYILYNRTKWSSYGFSNFVYLEKLETLKCFFFIQLPSRFPRQVNFVFPLQLRKLTLRGCRISWNRMTMVGSLPNLEVLKLKHYSFEGPVWEPNDDEFVSLKYLQLEELDLVQWKANDTHFPSLQHLSLRYCMKLKEIPFDIGETPTLQKIDVYGCSRSAEMSAILIQEEQQSLGNEGLQVRLDSVHDAVLNSLRQATMNGRRNKHVWW